jgi:nitroreductase/dihydropteridine reductase
MNFLESLEWRYATKRMNGEQIPDQKLKNILDAVQLAPSSFGLTPYNVIVLQDPAIKEKLAPHCYNQPQIKESSALLIFAPWKNINDDHVDSYMNEIATTRGIPTEALADFSNIIKGKVNSSSPEDLHVWAAKQAYIALGFGLAAAAVEAIDSTPMEGFNPAGVNEVLGLEAKGLSAVCILALGYRDAPQDYLANAKKVRRDKEKLFIKY